MATILTIGDCGARVRFLVGDDPVEPLAVSFLGFQR
jgi:hypothetical protein